MASFSGTPSMRELLEVFKHLKGIEREEWLRKFLGKRDISDYSEYFKFLSGVVKIHPGSLGIVIERIQEEWQNHESRVSLFKSTVSFLGRLKKTLRKQEFKDKISKLWPMVFSFPAQDRLKLHLVRAYRSELPFGWLYEFVLRDDFFYSENLNEPIFDAGAIAVMDVLMELIDKSRGDEELMDELRVSGLLEKIGSLWSSPALSNSESKIIKLLAMASSISGSTIFYSVPSLMDALLLLCDDLSVWTVRLVDSILRKYPKRHYVLSQSRAELNLISGQVIKIAVKAMERYAESSEMNRAVCGLVKSVLERWEGMACTVEDEVEFCAKVSEFLESSYKALEMEFASNLLNVFANEFIEPLLPQISAFFRNALKAAATLGKSTDPLNQFANILVNDGGTDRAFPLLFKEYPSLIGDVHKLLSQERDQLWLLTLAESPRTKKVLIDFLIDPEQVNSLESNEFWLNFMGRLTSGDFDRVNQWSKGQLMEQFLPRAKLCTAFDGYFYDLLKIIVQKKSATFNDNDIKFILCSCKANSEMFDWILSKIDCKAVILDNLMEFDGQSVFEIVKMDLMSVDEILSFLFQSKDEEMLMKAISQWNILIKSGNLEIVPDEQVNKTFFSKDYGGYLENLFESIQAGSGSQLISDSSDPIELFLEYYKYGQIRSMEVAQDHLLSRFKCIELLLRIPLAVLRTSGPQFGAIVLDNLIVNGLDEEDAKIIMTSPCSDYNFELLAMYYKNRIKQD